MCEVVSVLRAVKGDELSQSAEERCARAKEDGGSFEDGAAASAEGDYRMLRIARSCRKVAYVVGDALHRLWSPSSGYCLRRD